MNVTGSKRTWSHAMVAVTLLCAMAACDAGSGAVTVKALWYGKNQDGSPARGVLPVTIRGEVDGGGDLKVEMTGPSGSASPGTPGTGAYWNAAVQSAARVGALVAGVDPRGRTLSYAVPDSIDGPSAGALLALGTTAVLESQSVPDNVSMTGTLLPNGALGPVGGIPDKVRAAADAGLTRVYIPKGQAPYRDSHTGESTDVMALGSSLGVEVKEVATFQEVYAEIHPDSTSQQDPGPLNPALVGVLQAATDQLLTKLASAKPAAVSSPDLSSIRPAVVASVEQDRAEAVRVRESDPVAAFSRASRARRVLAEWDAVAEMAGRVAGAGAATAATELSDRVQKSRQEIAAQVEAVANRPVQWLEQYPALTDALALGVGAIASLDLLRTALTDANAVGASALSDYALAHARARFDGLECLPVAGEAALTVGRSNVSDSAAVLDRLSGYADFLAETAEANGRYFDQSAAHGAGPNKLPFDQSYLRALDIYWQEVADARSNSAGSTAGVLMKTAAAISRLVASAWLVIDLGAAEAVGGGPNVLVEVAALKSGVYSSQATTAEHVTSDLSRELAARNLDTSYPRWADQWGRLLADQPGISADAGQRKRDALGYQWNANLDLALLDVIDGTKGGTGQ